MKQLAERRTDIFGVGDEETAIGKKIGEEDKRKDDKVILVVIFNIMHQLARAVFAEMLDNSQHLMWLIPEIQNCSLDSSHKNLSTSI